MLVVAAPNPHRRANLPPDCSSEPPPINKNRFSSEHLYPDTGLFEFDAFGLLTDVFLDPSTFGFTNVNEAYYSEFVVPGGETCVNPDEFLSWDAFHPTTATRQLMAAQVVVPVPAAVWLFVSGLIEFLNLARRSQA